MRIGKILNRDKKEENYWGSYKRDYDTICCSGQTVPSFPFQ